MFVEDFWYEDKIYMFKLSQIFKHSYFEKVNNWPVIIDGLTTKEETIFSMRGCLL